MRNYYRRFIAIENRGEREGSTGKGWEGKKRGSKRYVKQRIYRRTYLSEGIVYVAIGQQTEQVVPGSKLSNVRPLMNNNNRNEVVKICKEFQFVK